MKVQTKVIIAEVQHTFEVGELYPVEIEYREFPEEASLLVTVWKDKFNVSGYETGDFPRIKLIRKKRSAAVIVDKNVVFIHFGDDWNPFSPIAVKTLTHVTKLFSQDDSFSRSSFEKIHSDILEILRGERDDNRE